MVSAMLDEGAGEFVIGDETRRAGQGMVVWAPAGVTHGVTNTGGSRLVLLVGIYDDLRGTNAVVKFVSLGLISSLFYAMGGRIDALSIPFVGSVELPVLLSFLIALMYSRDWRDTAD